MPKRKSERDEPVLTEADVPAWKNPTLLEALENILRGDGRPSPERRRIAEGLSSIGSMIPGPGTVDAYDMLRRGEGLDDYIGGAAGMLMAGAGRPLSSAARAAMAKAKAARYGSIGLGASVPISEGLRDDDTDGPSGNGFLTAPSPPRPPMVPVDLDGNPVYDEPSRLPPSSFDHGREFIGMNRGGMVNRALDALGFFSKAAEEAKALKQEKGTPEQIRAMLLKSGVKPDELKWTGFDDWAKGKKQITRDEAVQFLEQNRVQVGETRLGRGYTARMSELDAAARERRLTPEEKAEYEALSASANGRAPMTKYDQYTLPGGDNYREVLLTRPVKAAEWNGSPERLAFEEEMKAKYGAGTLQRTFSRMSPDEIDRYELLTRMERQKNTSKQEESLYQSSHWDDPNVLAHLRMKDRVDPEGRRVLHLEELQSDWAQEGRKKGFATGDNSARIAELQQQARDLIAGRQPRDMSPEELERVRVISDEAMALGANKQGIPAGPYVDSTQKWTDLALKRALREAADGGYDALAWTPGAEQAKRYDLSKQVSNVNYIPGSGVLTATDHQGTSVINKSGITPEQLSDYIGKEAAEKLLKSEPTQFGQTAMHSLSGEDLRVGGEGMIGYYDKIVPTQLQKLAKGLDPEAPFGTLNIDAPRGKPTQYRDFDEYKNTPETQAMSLPSLTITPKMREAIKQGLPLFTMAPPMMLPPSSFDEEPQEFSKGGKVDRLPYWDSVPLGWYNPESDDVRDYRDTELHTPYRPRPSLRRPGRGIDPMREGYEERWQEELKGYEDGGEVEDVEVEDDMDDMEEGPRGEETYVAQDESDFKEALRLWATTPPFKDHRPEAIKWRLIPAFRNGRLLMLARDGEIVGFAIWGWMTNREYQTRKYSGEEVFSRERGDKIVITDSAINGSVTKFSRQMAEYFRENYPDATHVYAHRRGGREASFSIKKVLGDA